MVALVSVDQARDRLRIDEAYAEADLERMAVEATDIVLDYIKGERDWTEETAPPRVQASILLVMRNLYDGAEQPLSEPAKNLVYRLRDPALA